MKSILKSLIDYTLFEKYDKEYFINNKIIPIFENDISIKDIMIKIGDNIVKQLAEIFKTSSEFSHFYDSEGKEWLGIRKK